MSKLDHFVFIIATIIVIITVSFLVGRHERMQWCKRVPDISHKAVVECLKEPEWMKK